MRYSPYNEEKDPNAMIDWDEWAALVDRPEFQAVMDAAEDALDPEVQAIVNAVCNWVEREDSAGVGGPGSTVPQWRRIREVARWPCRTNGA